MCFEMISGGPESSILTDHQRPLLSCLSSCAFACGYLSPYPFFIFCISRFWRLSHLASSIFYFAVFQLSACPLCDWVRAQLDLWVEI
ncbi:hypothetical protein BCR43DRAFT_490343 [Syncephalastrum racemosum]|uniref:Uncharacterized protein n=1 Tax=Syncephalastrum racemosum TaxID=13706 RepID=A0A1X2HFS1_SYNRA|nr:hypothetical protein BCR43DRAFT_490343 [Syncephalastrum racemosum]